MPKHGTQFFVSPIAFAIKLCIDRSSFLYNATRSLRYHTIYIVETLDHWKVNAIRGPMTHIG